VTRLTFQMLRICPHDGKVEVPPKFGGVTHE
jgi:hypothetical protein